MKLIPVNNNIQNFGIQLPNKVRKKQRQAEELTPTENLITAQNIGSELFGINDEIKSSKKGIEEYIKFRKMQKCFMGETQRVYDSAVELAKMAHSPQVEEWHLYLASLIKLRNYISEFEEGTVDPISETLYAMPSRFQEYFYKGCAVWQDEKLRKEGAQILDKHIVYMMDTYFKEDQQMYPQPRRFQPSLSADAINTAYEAHKVFIQETETDDFTDCYWVDMASFSKDKRLRRELIYLLADLQTAGMTEKLESRNKNRIEFYDKKAEAIWQNISYGNNVLILNNPEDAQAFEYVKDSFVNLINQQGASFGNLNADNTEVVLLNDKATMAFLDDTIRSIRADKTKKDKTIVFVGDIKKILLTLADQMDENAAPNPDAILTLLGTNAQNKGKTNIRFLMTATPEYFHKEAQKPGTQTSYVLNSYAQQVLPILNGAEAKNHLTNQSGLEFIKAEIKKELSAETVHKAIELTSAKPGNYPQKAIALLNSVAKYFVKADEITPTHVETYLRETDSLSDVIMTDENNVIFDTGKSLKDIKGMPMTLASAETIVRQIKDGTVGTRGYIIYHDGGTSYGGGRRHSAEAIAGETQIPMLVMNAKDFAAKDIDKLAMEASLSELKIKKLVQSAKAQAETNDLKTAMIYIENFDNFAADQYWGFSTVYEQKAFTQLLAEMDAVRKEGKVNLVVVGSMNFPELLDQSIMKPYKFLNQFIVYQPQDTEQRREILDYYIQKGDIKIAGDFSQRETILNDISDTTEGSTVVDLMYLLDTANIVSRERGKDAIDYSDFIEAYLQTISGKANPAKNSESWKKIVTSHEAGHGLTLHLMYEIAKKHKKPWHIPDKLDFITLDPRGRYGGAMFPKRSENEEYSFECMMSDIICAYGGYSTESAIYNMSGSWGINMDMKDATLKAEQAVTKMGMGAKTGVRAVYDRGFVSEKQREKIADDVDVILKSAKSISDDIISEYKGFIEEFTARHYPKVATGECIIPSKEFISELNDWRDRQTPEKQAKLNALETKIIGKIEACKKGQV